MYMYNSPVILIPLFLNFIHTVSDLLLIVLLHLVFVILIQVWVRSFFVVKCHPSFRMFPMVLCALVYMLYASSNCCVTYPPSIPVSGDTFTYASSYNLSHNSCAFVYCNIHLLISAWHTSFVGRPHPFPLHSHHQTYTIVLQNTKQLISKRIVSICRHVITHSVLIRVLMSKRAAHNTNTLPN
eukprot:130542_1